MSRESTGHSKHPFQQHKRQLYTWASPDGQHRNQMDYTLFSWRWKSSIQSAKTKLGVNYGSAHELLIAKFRLKLKKVGKTNRPFRDDLNQLLNDYTMEVTNSFKGLDLIASAWRTMDGDLWHCTGFADQKCCIQYARKVGKLSSGHRTRKGQFSFQSQRKAVSKNVQLPHRCTHITYYQSNFSKQVFNSTYTVKFHIFKMDLEKEPNIKLPTSFGS